jgi:hypothetical protein
MSRNLDSTMAAHLGDGVIQPVILAELTLNSGLKPLTISLSRKEPLNG